MSGPYPIKARASGVFEVVLCEQPALIRIVLDADELRFPPEALDDLILALQWARGEVIAAGGGT